MKYFVDINVKKERSQERSLRDSVKKFLPRTCNGSQFNLMRPVPKVAFQELYRLLCKPISLQFLQLKVDEGGSQRPWTGPLELHQYVAA